MGFLKRYWGTSFFFVSVIGVFICWYSGFRAQSVMRSPSAENAGSQFQHDVLDALDTLRSSGTVRDWRTSGYMPSDVLSNTLALKRPEARAGLCTALRNLSSEELSVFEASISAPATQRDLPCTRELLDKIGKYWITQTEAADARAKPEPESVSSGTKKLKLDSIRDITPELLQNGEYVLVFDGNIDPLITREILQTLDERNVKAIFAIPGSSARDYANVVEVMTRVGQTLGSESTELRDMSLLPLSIADQSIGDGAHAVEVAGRVDKVRLFSFPLGSSNDSLEGLVSKHGFKELRPNLDSEDWKTFNSARLQETVRRKLASSPKGILLFHSNLRQTAIALPGILDELAADHRRVVGFDVK